MMDALMSEYNPDSAATQLPHVTDMRQYINRYINNVSTADKILLAQIMQDDNPRALRECPDGIAVVLDSISNDALGRVYSLLFHLIGKFNAPKI